MPCSEAKAQGRTAGERETFPRSGNWCGSATLQREKAQHHIPRLSWLRASLPLQRARRGDGDGLNGVRPSETLLWAAGVAEGEQLMHREPWPAGATAPLAAHTAHTSHGTMQAPRGDAHWDHFSKNQGGQGSAKSCRERNLQQQVFLH